MPPCGPLARTLTALWALPVITAACASNTGRGGAASSGLESPSVTAIQTTQESTVADIRIAIAGETISGHLYDNPTARDLAQRLPTTLTFHDFNHVEKIARLAQPLTTQGVPAGDDPEVADIGYYAPTQDLVLYYGDVGYWSGIIRVGQFDSNQLALVQNQPDGSDITIEND
jgi:hypothetical protein